MVSFAIALFFYHLDVGFLLGSSFEKSRGSGPSIFTLHTSLFKSIVDLNTKSCLIFHADDSYLYTTGALSPMDELKFSERMIALSQIHSGLYPGQIFIDEIQNLISLMGRASLEVSSSSFSVFKETHQKTKSSIILGYLIEEAETNPNVMKAFWSEEANLDMYTKKKAMKEKFMNDQRPKTPGSKIQRKLTSAGSSRKQLP